MLNFVQLNNFRKMLNEKQLYKIGRCSGLKHKNHHKKSIRNFIKHHKTTMLKLQTPVIDEPCKVGISYNDKIMMIGSCFSDNIGKQLKDFGFNVCINPFGTLYNPKSIANSIERLVSGEKFTKNDCIQMGSGSDKWCSFMHHTSFADSDKSTFLSKANTSLLEAREFFKDCNKVIITLGTSWCFKWNSSGEIVSNCLKRDAKEFTRVRLTLEEASKSLKDIVKTSNSFGKEKEFIFTVSPIRHFKDGAHGNQLSKSTLLLACERMRKNLRSNMPFFAIDYFPAYEIMMDELRDYRFYADDMIHPSPLAIDYIRQRFLLWALPKEEHNTLEANIKAFKRSQHINLMSQKFWFV